MELVLLIQSSFSKAFFAQIKASAYLFTAERPLDFVVEAIAPSECGTLHLPLRIGGMRALKAYQTWQMLRQALAWNPGAGRVEIHCRGIVAGFLGMLVKFRFKASHELVLYLDRSDVAGYSRRLRHAFAAFVSRRADYLIVETPDDITVLNSSVREIASKVLTVRQLLGDLRPVSCVHMHPERLAMLPYCQGKGIDVGCGSSKTHPDAIGVDIVVAWTPGSVGSEDGRLSCADVSASGDRLEMFDDDSLDYVIARHNIEHYVDIVRTLREWGRVLRRGGTLALVIPDDEALDTVRLDPSHKHAFTRESFLNLVHAVGGFEVREIDVCVPKWSFKCVLRKSGAA